MLNPWDEPFDDGPVLYEDLARLLDPRIVHLQDVIDSDFDMADAMDYPEDVDAMLGVGLVIAQQWVIAAVTERGAQREAALDLGPRVGADTSAVRLVVHGANLWKHACEWNWDSPDHRQRRIRDALAAAGVSENGYVLWDLMTALTGERSPQLGHLSPLLRQWHGELQRAFPSPKRMTPASAAEQAPQPDAPEVGAQ